MPKDSLVFHAVTAVTVLLFLWGLYEHIAFWFRGNMRPKVPGSTGQKLSYILRQTGRVLSTGASYSYILSNVILQRQTLRESLTRWYMHMSLMWGLIGLFFIGSLSNMAMDLHLVSFTKDTPWFAVLNDVFGLLVLLGAIVALARRHIFGVHQLRSTLDDIVIMAGVGFGVLSGYFVEASRMNLEGVSAAAGAYSFVGQGVRNLLPAAWPWSGIYASVWWAHFLAGSAIGAYLPHSKLFHMIISPLSVVASSLREAEKQRA